MNYLAHAFLSFNDADVLTGNMISDFVKGNRQYNYPPAIQRGITLHRAIDEFTDTHEATRKLKEFFRPQYRLYAGAFADIVYDYFLANDKKNFETEDSLLKFAEQCYMQLETNEAWFGGTFSQLYPYMKIQNWLYNYRYEWAMGKSFEGMRRRSRYIAETAIAFDIFTKYKNEMQPYYDDFFPQVKCFAQNKLEQLLK